MKKKIQKAKLKTKFSSTVKSKDILKYRHTINAIPKTEQELDQIAQSEVKDLEKIIADIATGVWRMRDKFKKVDMDDLPDEIKKAHRYVQSTWDALTTNKVEIRDHTNEKFPQGSPALKVIASQPTPSVQYEVITETIKPTIYYNGRLIQMGQVIVATPEPAQSDENLENNSPDSHTSSNKSNHELTPDSSKESAKTDNTKDISNNKGRGAK